MLTAPGPQLRRRKVVPIRREAIACFKNEAARVPEREREREREEAAGTQLWGAAEMPSLPALLAFPSSSAPRTPPIRLVGRAARRCSGSLCRFSVLLDLVPGVGLHVRVLCLRVLSYEYSYIQY